MYIYILNQREREGEGEGEGEGENQRVRLSVSLVRTSCDTCAPKREVSELAKGFPDACKGHIRLLWSITPTTGIALLS